MSTRSFEKLGESNRMIKDLFESEHYVGFVLENLKRIADVRTDGQLAELLGVSPSNVSTWKTRKTLPYKEITQFCIFNDIPIDQIIYGVEDSNQSNVADASGEYVRGTQLSDFQLVPRMDIQVSGGHGALVSSEQVVDHLAFRQDWLKKKGLNPDDLALVEIIGDSMEPKLASGDTVLIDISQTKIRGGSAYVVRIGEDLVVKYLQLIPGEQIQVSSENPSYPPYTINKGQMDGEFMVVGKVVASNHEWR